jgi:hypothetical protein
LWVECSKRIFLNESVPYRPLIPHGSNRLSINRVIPKIADNEKTSRVQKVKQLDSSDWIVFDFYKVERQWEKITDFSVPKNR